MIDEVICPYCGVARKRLWLHIKSAHDKSMSEAKSEFPNYKWFADSESEKFTNAARVMLSNESNKDKIRAAGTKNLIEFNKTQWTDAQRVKRSQIQSDKWKDPEYRNKWHETRMQPDNLTRCAMNKFKMKEYPNGLFRSSYESQCALVLTQLDYTYEYEPFYVRYQYEGKDYSYSVDFYLKEFNMIIEVKPKKFINLPKNQAKMKGSLNAGYNYIFLTEDELWNPDKVQELIKSSTTIENVIK